MSAALITLAQQVGAPLLLNVLRGKIGQRNTELVEDVVGAIATRAGIEVADIDQMTTDNPDVIAAAISDVETTQLPEQIALYEAALQRSHELQLAEMSKGPWIVWAWRPLWMYGLFILWFWQTSLIHVANAIWKTAMPQMDLTLLLAVTSLFLSLYMGGHTIKKVAETWKAK